MLLPVFVCSISMISGRSQYVVMVYNQNDTKSFKL